MNNIRAHKQNTKTGFEQTITQYKAQNCGKCPLKSSFHKAKGNRIIHVNHKLKKQKKKAKGLLLNDSGIAHRKKRCWDVEAIFREHSP